MRKATEIEKKLKMSYDEDQTHNEQKAVSAIKKNIMYFFTYTKRFSNAKLGVGRLIDGGKAITNSHEMVDILSIQYESVFCAPKEPMITPYVMFPDMEKF